MAKFPWYFRDITWNRDFGKITFRPHPLWVFWMKLKLKLRRIPPLADEAADEAGGCAPHQGRSDDDRSELLPAAPAPDLEGFRPVSEDADEYPQCSECEAGMNLKRKVRLLKRAEKLLKEAGETFLAFDTSVAIAEAEDDLKRLQTNEEGERFVRQA